MGKRGRRLRPQHRYCSAVGRDHSVRLQSIRFGGTQAGTPAPALEKIGSQIASFFPRGAIQNGCHSEWCIALASRRRTSRGAVASHTRRPKGFSGNFRRNYDKCTSDPWRFEWRRTPGVGGSGLVQCDVCDDVGSAFPSPRHACCDL
jgi:hypothetical protein